MAAKAGTKENPWKLKTPPGTSEFEAYKDEASDPPALVVQVGSTQLRYYLRCIEDLHAMLKAHGDWMLLGSGTNKKALRRTPWRHGADRRRIQWAGGVA